LPTPKRLIDTRQFGQMPLAGGETRQIPVTGAAPLPAAGGIVAAVLNVTVIGTAGEGYWTVFPHDSARPDASNLNIDETSALTGGSLAIPNLVTVPVGPSGIVDVFSYAGGSLIVDFLGYYAPATAATAGRFTPLAAPQRFVDTRQPGQSALFPTSTIEYRAPGAAGASAVVLNVTVVALSGGFWTVFPSGQPVPDASNLNVSYPGHVVANQVIVPVDADGDFSVYTYGGGHAIIDLIGSFTGASAPSSTAGLFTALDRPTRFLDTRSTGKPLEPNWSTDLAIASNPAINRSDISAVVMNVTMTEALAPGYVAVTPAGSADPALPGRLTSTLNPARPGQTLPNHAIVPVSSRGINLFTDHGGHLIVDVAGYYSGAAAPSPFPTAQNPPTPVGPLAPGCIGYPNLAVRPVVKGSSKATVSIAQNRLLSLGFYLTAADGNYGLTTSQAVMAFQFWKGLRPTSVLDEATAVALNNEVCRPTPGVAGSDLLEINKGKQIAMIIRDGQVDWVFHVSTGNGQNYDEANKKDPGGREIGIAITRPGSFRVYRVSDEVRYEGSLGTMYRPRFFDGGIAVHGAPNVPNYPASHGCVRVVNPVMDWIWGNNLLPMGGRVVVHE
jgi:L,D-transpeptidase catalytic domain/Putative peptidoglycan binding domain